MIKDFYLQKLVYQNVADRSRTVATLPVWRIYWSETPGLWIDDDQQRYYPDASSIIAIPPRCPIDQGMTEPFSLLSILVNAGPVLNRCRRILTYPCNDMTRKELKMIVSSVKIGKTYSEADLTQQILLKIYGISCTVLGQIEPDDLTVPNIDERVGRAISLMQSRKAAGLSNDDLMAAAGVSMNSLIRLFRKYTGMTPQEFYRIIRLEAAAEMLLSTSMSIDEISERTSFCERSHFSKAFKTKFGIAPATYRRLSQ